MIRQGINNRRARFARSPQKVLDWAGSFTPERPMIVSQAMYDDIVAVPELASIVPNLRVQTMIPVK